MLPFSAFSPLSHCPPRASSSPEVHGIQESLDQSDISFQQFPFFQKRFFTGDIKGVTGQGHKDRHLPVFKTERQGNVELLIKEINTLNHLWRHNAHGVQRIVRKNYEALLKGRKFRFHLLPGPRI